MKPNGKCVPNIKKALIVASLSLGSLTVVSPANADFWSFSYADTGPGTVAYGSGTFETGAVGSPYTIMGIAGTANGSIITGLSPYAAATNLLYVPGNADFGGISFHTSAGIDWNLFSNFGDMQALRSDTNPGGFAPGPSISMSVTPIPEPETYAMLLAGLGLLGFAARRRRQKEAAAA
jgi:hypothetical protein